MARVGHSGWHSSCSAPPSLTVPDSETDSGSARDSDSDSESESVIASHGTAGTITVRSPASLRLRLIEILMDTA